MTSKPYIWILVALSTSALVLTVLNRRLVVAQRGANQSRERLTQVALDLNSLQALGAERQFAQASEPPSDDLLSQIRRVLKAVGIEASFHRVNRQSDAPLAGRSRDGQSGPAYRRRDEALFLKTVPLNDLGAFLVAWREECPLWQVTAIDLTRPNGTPPKNVDYDVRLQLTTVYIAMHSGDTP